jgi:hypothetical protein
MADGSIAAKGMILCQAIAYLNILPDSVLKFVAIHHPPDTLCLSHFNRDSSFVHTMRPYKSTVANSRKTARNTFINMMNQ